MQFLYQLKPVRAAMVAEGPTEQEAAVLAAHLDYLRAASQAGVVLMAGRTVREDDSVFGICVFQAENEAEATDFMHADPAIAHGIMHAELHPYRVAVWSTKGPAGLL